MQKIVLLVLTSTHKYCSHIKKNALNVSKHNAISNNIITSKYPVHPPSSGPFPLHLPEISGKRLGSWFYQTSISKNYIINNDDNNNNNNNNNSNNKEQEWAMQLAAKIISPALRNFGIFPHNENMPTVSHQNAFYFLRCVHVRYVQCLFT